MIDTDTLFMRSIHRKEKPIFFFNILKMLNRTNKCRAVLGKIVRFVAILLRIKLNPIEPIEIHEIDYYHILTLFLAKGKLIRMIDAFARVFYYSLAFCNVNYFRS